MPQQGTRSSSSSSKPVCCWLAAGQAQADFAQADYCITQTDDVDEFPLAFSENRHSRLSIVAKLTPCGIVSKMSVNGRGRKCFD